jgi:hypothetical protein
MQSPYTFAAFYDMMQKAHGQKPKGRGALINHHMWNTNGHDKTLKGEFK